MWYPIKRSIKKPLLKYIFSGGWRSQAFDLLMAQCYIEVFKTGTAKALDANRLEVFYE